MTKQGHKAAIEAAKKVAKFYKTGAYTMEQAADMLASHAVAISKRFEGVRDATTLEQIREHAKNNAAACIAMYL